MADNKNGTNKKVVIAIIASIIVVIGIIAIIIGVMNRKTTNVEAKKEYHIGETIITDKDFEITLRNAEFGSNYYRNGTGNKYMTANDNEYYEKGKCFLTFEYTIKYVGKTKIDYNQYEIGQDIKLDYNSGYIFEVESVCIQNKNENENDENVVTWSLTHAGPGVWTGNKKEITFEPLDDTTYLARGVFKIPNEIKENSSAPLKLVFEGNEYNLRISQ